MKQEFEEPVMEVILFNSNDVIATSGGDVNGEDEIPDYFDVEFN